MQTTTLTAPSFLAPALINGDYSDMTTDDAQRLSAFLSREGVRAGDCLDCADAGFIRLHDAHHEFGASDCQEYTFAIRKEA